MPPHTIAVGPELYDYLLAVSLRESPLKARLRQETEALGGAGSMQISPDQGQFMALLARLIGARRAVEVGTFTGYSALCVAEALPPDGKLVACDIDPEWTAIGRRYWQEAGVAGRIELRLGDATASLEELLAEGWADNVDMMFIDADKTGYLDYYRLGMELVRPGGLILIDNVLWSGSVLDTSSASADTRAIRELNAALATDERIDLTLLPMGDGLTLARKR